MYRQTRLYTSLCVSCDKYCINVSFPIFFVVLLHLTVSCNYYRTFAGGMVQLIDMQTEPLQLWQLWQEHFAVDDLALGHKWPSPHSKCKVIGLQIKDTGIW